MSARHACLTCDGTGCPCFRWRDWQSIELGCHDGCPECGLNTCTPDRSESTTSGEPKEGPVQSES